MDNDSTHLETSTILADIIHSKPLTAIVGEDSGAIAVRSAGEVVKYVENMIPEFEMLKDCVLRLLKVYIFHLWFVDFQLTHFIGKWAIQIGVPRK